MKAIEIRLRDSTLAQLDARAVAEGTSRSAIIREMVETGLANTALTNSQAELANTLDRVLRPHVERLAALAAKAAVAAGTAEWLSVVLASATPGLDYKTAHVEARKKAVANLRMRNREEDEEE